MCQHHLKIESSRNNYHDKYKRKVKISFIQLPKLPQETTSGSKCLPEKMSPSLLSLLLALLDEGDGLGSRGLFFRSRTDKVSDNRSKPAEDCGITSFNAVPNSLVRFLLLSAECTACQIDNDIYV